MGVLNATPDSFSDGGRYYQAEAARAHVDRLLDEGADLIDVGGESSRPGAEPVAAEEQIRRIGPALAHAVERGALVSIDTTSPEVAEHALRHGARVVNDVSCLANPELATVTARHGAVLILMHSREPMSTLRGFSCYPDDAYGDVVADVAAEWRGARDRALERGMPEDDVWLDPGLGFAKNARHSFELLRRLSELVAQGAPVVVGPSRKSFISAVDESPPSERLGGTIAACLHAARAGAQVLRVHDVAPVRQALAVARRLGAPSEEAARAG
jgi:dihydropteroate synthase